MTNIPISTGAGYWGVGAVVTFVTLTTIWTRIYRPKGDRGAGWKDGEIVWYGVGQAVFWPLFGAAYLIWGVLAAINLAGHTYLRFIKPKPVLVARVVEPDQYEVAAEKEVNKLLEDPWAGR